MVRPGEATHRNTTTFQGGHRNCPDEKALGRPICTPRAFARARPSPVGALISLKLGNTGKHRDQHAVVSAQASASDLKPMERSPSVCRMLSKSRVDLASD